VDGFSFTVWPGAWGFIGGPAIHLADGLLVL
jgi:hypothetical protein